MLSGRLTMTSVNVKQTGKMTVARLIPEHVHQPAQLEIPVHVDPTPMIVIHVSYMHIVTTKENVSVTKTGVQLTALATRDHVIVDVKDPALDQAATNVTLVKNTQKGISMASVAV